MQSHDLVWIVPFAGATGAALHYDAEAQQKLGYDKNRIDLSKNISKIGSPYATLGEGAALYLLGAASKNEHLSETGRLGAEAVIDASIVTEALKLATNRQRPYQGDGQGDFWPHGGKQYNFDGSFPSGHAAASWALARVIASEYPGPLTKLTVYGAATAISVARVTSRDHFPSDVLVGTTFGYLIGGYVYRHHAGGEVDNSFLITPDINQATHSYGARLDLSPGALVHPVRAFRETLR
jgi:PAP2 superfamily protein